MGGDLSELRKYVVIAVIHNVINFAYKFYITEHQKIKSFGVFLTLDRKSREKVKVRIIKKMCIYVFKIIVKNIYN